MFTILTYLIFIVSVALTAAGIILSSRLRNKFQPDIFSSLLYHQVFIYTFGFYGIWGQAGIRAFLSPAVSEELISKFSEVGMFLGLPFLVFAWLMLLRFSISLSGRKPSNWFIFLFLLLNFSVLIILGYLITGKSKVNTLNIIIEYYIIMNLVHSFLASYLIHFPVKRRPVIPHNYRRIISFSIFLIMIAQCTPLLFYNSQPLTAVIFIFAFFLGNIFLPLYFSYSAVNSAFATEPERDLSFEELCRKYEISPRESDIIREICNGLSNKEISDRLFISLQTVKDHTHRIYIKTNVKSRVQLVTLVKGVLS